MTSSKLFFKPVHPLNFPVAELLAELEQPSPRWPAVTRVVELYADEAGQLAVQVCLRPAAQPGHIDNVRCYVARLGARTAFANPRAAVNLAEAAEQCEQQMQDIVAKLYGPPQKAAG